MYALMHQHGQCWDRLDWDRDICQAERSYRLP